MHDQPMDEHERRRLWKIATEKNGWSAESIGQQLKLKGKTLDAAVKRGSMRGKAAPALDAWLLKNALTLAAGYSSGSGVANPFVSYGRLCTSMGEDLQARPDPSKQRRLSRPWHFLGIDQPGNTNFKLIHVKLVLRHRHPEPLRQRPQLTVQPNKLGVNLHATDHWGPLPLRLQSVTPGLLPLVPVPRRR